MKQDLKICTMVLLMLFGSICGGCGQHLEELGGQTTASVKSNQRPPELAGVYPIGAGVHSERGASNDSPQRATVLNAIAYARYAAELNGAPDIGRVENPVEIAETLAAQAEHSGVEYFDALRYRDVIARNHAYDDYYNELKADARTLAGTGELSRQGRGIMDGAARVNTCVSDGYSPVACCQALAWVEALGDIENSASSYREATRLGLDSQLLGYQAGERASVQPFSQSGVRSWLSYCSGDVTDAPFDIAGFKVRFGDYHVDSQWVVELHPMSPAKQAGRRIYRRVLPDDTWVSVAESTSDDCTVRETETIVMRRGEQAEFWAFDAHGRRVSHAYFPTRRPGEDAARFVPNACMGCHYTMDTRRFVVPAPSFESLNLKLFEADGVPVWRDHSHCAVPQETMVFHEVTTIGR